MSTHHHPAACDQCWDPDETTVAREPTAAQKEAIELLGYKVGRLVRLTVADWARVDRIATWAAAARTPQREEKS